MITTLLAKFLGSRNDREVKKLQPIVEEVNAFEPLVQALSDEALAAKTNELRQQLSNGKTLDDILPEAFAVVREASKRTLGQRHYDVQIMGGLVMHQGKIVEQGSVKSIYEKPKASYTRELLNAIPGKHFNFKVS